MQVDERTKKVTASRRMQERKERSKMMFKPKVIQFHGRYYHVHPNTPEDFLFRKLDETEERAFLKWAQEQGENVEVNPLWHPVVQHEIYTRGRNKE